MIEKNDDDDEGTNELKDFLKSCNMSFSVNYKAQFIKLIDALRDCNKTRRLSSRGIDNALIAGQQAIELNERLFKQATSSRGRKKIRLVMAVIDDRAIAKEKEGADVSSIRDTELFHLQDLWGLDKTSRYVQKCGFTFVMKEFLQLMMYLEISKNLYRRM